MYKWPQGRVIRTVCLILLLLIAADLGYHGAYGPLELWARDNNAKQLGVGLFFATLTAAVLIAGLVLVGFKAFSVDFLIEVEQEMVKVEWPTSSVLIRSTIVIAIATAIVGGIIYAVDVINFHLFLDWLPKLFQHLSV